MDQHRNPFGYSSSNDLPSTGSAAEDGDVIEGSGVSYDDDYSPGSLVIDAEEIGE
jgi:hypothetical protein